MKMSQMISDRTALVLRSSISTVEAYKLPIIEEMAASLAAADRKRGQQWAEGAAARLVNMLIDQAHHLIAAGAPHDLEAIRREHLGNDINGLHYSRFGDALSAVMVDAAGAALPKSIGGAWGDAFWTVIAQLRLQDGAWGAGQPDRSKSNEAITPVPAGVA